MKVKKILIPLLLGVSLLCGAAMLIFGIRDAIALNQRTKDYESTEGYLSGYDIYSEAKTTGRRHKSATYRLYYAYIVDGMEYTVSTTYGTGIVPEMGSTREVLYDPYEPSAAVLAGTSSPVILIFGGAMFLGVPGVMIFVMLLAMGDYKVKRINIMDVVIGLVFGGISLGFLYLMADTLNPIEAFQRTGFLTAIPMVMVAAGVYLVLRGIFFPNALDKMKGPENDEADTIDY